jgi:hypothetical protein
MIADDSHVKKIIEWRESLATLPDNHFFDMVRMYLGEIKTPFNKQKLIEELGCFLRKEEIRRTIIKLLSDDDILILSAVKLIPDVTQEKLTAFFSETFSFAVLFEHVLNLEERLILYRRTDHKTSRSTLLINPMLEDILAPFLSLDILLPKPVSVIPAKTVSPILSPELIAAFFSYLSSDGCLCKSDGTFKKRAAVVLETIFPFRLTQLQLLVAAFINLSLVKESDQGLEIDRNRFFLFAKLPVIVQYAYLAVSSQGRFSRDGLVRQSQLLLDCASSIPLTGFTRTTLLRFVSLISEKNAQQCGNVLQGVPERFSAIINRARSLKQDEEIAVGPNQILVFDRLIECATVFGLFSLIGETPEGESVYGVGPVYSLSPLDKIVPVLSVDAGFTVTMLPGLSLLQMLSLVTFMDIQQFDTAAVYEITRKSVMRSFDGGENAESVCKLLSLYTSYHIPQNLQVSIEEWGRAYSSGSLYKGYILQVSHDRCPVTENNPVLHPYIKKILAPGIYLLSVFSDEEAKNLIMKSGLDFIGTIKTAEPDPVTPGFPALNSCRTVSLFEDATMKSFASSKSSAFIRASKSECSAFFDDMKKSLLLLELNSSQIDGLLSRIERKIILNKDQLRGETVRIEQIEAGGMDFLGKVHVIEQAISSDNMIELEYGTPVVNGVTADSEIIVGIPLSVEKRADDALISIRIEPEQIEKQLSIGQARFVKRIRGSVLNQK